MPQAIQFENHFAKRVVEVFFPDGYQIETEDDLKELKSRWSENLKSWHSPYTCLFDVRKFSVGEAHVRAFERMIRFFSSFHMKKLIGFSDAPLEEKYPFEVVVGYEAAVSQTGLGREGGLKRDLGDLRSRIQIENDFNAHVMEVSFLADTDFLTPADIAILKSKLTNNLRQWHSPYSVLINLVNCTIAEEARPAVLQMEKFLSSFFCKQVMGYAPKAGKENYPFKTFRSRHLAAAELEHSGIDSGAVANCSTRGKETK